MSGTGRFQRTAEGERFADVGRGVRLCYETFGDPDDPTVLLVMGLAMQMIAWPEELCEMLVERGLYVVRFDNRDIGRSSRMDDVPPPSAPRMLARRFASSQYDIADMARDTAGLLAALDRGPVHVVGVSMGGMIGQTLAAQYPDDVLSLVSISSSTGASRVGRPTPATLRLVMSRPEPGLDGAVARTVAVYRHIGSHGYPFDEERVSSLARHAYERGPSAAGIARQMGAILKSGDRTAELRAIAAPTLVLHGDRDRMVNPSGGRATARAIPGARFETIAGLGHDLPLDALPLLVDLIAGHIELAGAAADRA